MIKKCNCKHDFQDSVYGKGNRLHTTGVKGDHRCTVCGGPPRIVQRLKEHARNHIKQVHG